MRSPIFLMACLTELEENLLIRYQSIQRDRGFDDERSLLRKLSEEIIELRRLRDLRFSGKYH